MERSPPGLVVELHDVSAASLPETRWLLDELDARSIGPRVLLVVPVAEGQPLDASPELLALLQREVARGGQVVQHGFTHLGGPIRSGSPPERLRARWTAGGTAELLALDDQEARAAIRAGRDLLARCGFATDLFCAPAWLEGRPLGPMLAELGFRWRLGLLELEEVTSGRRVPAPPAGYMGNHPLAELLITAGSFLSLAAGRLARLPLRRIFLHPRGAPHSRAAWRTLELAERLTRRSPVVTYAALAADAGG